MFLPSISDVSTVLQEREGERERGRWGEIQTPTFLMSNIFYLCPLMSSNVK
jgi:hypothetical protein